MSARILNKIMNHPITTKIIKDPRSTFGIACAGALVSSQSLFLGIMFLAAMGAIIFMAPNWTNIKENPKKEAPEAAKPNDSKSSKPADSEDKT